MKCYSNKDKLDVETLTYRLSNKQKIYFTLKSFMNKLSTD